MFIANPIVGLPSFPYMSTAKKSSLTIGRHVGKRERTAKYGHEKIYGQTAKNRKQIFDYSFEKE